MNQVLRELEGKQWVLRHPHPGHRRVLQAQLTASGRRVLRGCRQAVDAVEARMLADLPRTQQRLFAQALRTCVEALATSGADSGRYGCRAASPVAVAPPASADDGVHAERRACAHRRRASSGKLRRGSVANQLLVMAPQPLKDAFLDIGWIESVHG